MNDRIPTTGNLERSLCPGCGSDEVTIHTYDNGVDGETGWHDRGERFRCRACGETGDPEDLV